MHEMRMYLEPLTQSEALMADISKKFTMVLQPIFWINPRKWII